MALYLRTFAALPKLRDKSFGEGREFIQRANLVAQERGHGSVFEFRFNEADGHLPPSILTPLTIDHFTILKETRKLADGGTFDRLYLGLDSRADFQTPEGGKNVPRLGVEPWDGEVEKMVYGDRVTYRQQVQLFDVDTYDGFPFELISSDPGEVLKPGQVYALTHRNFKQAAYGGLRIDTRSHFEPIKKAS